MGVDFRAALLSSCQCPGSLACGRSSRVGATDLMRRACSCQSDEAEREAHSERAICEGEIELRGTIVAETGGLHMGWNGTDGVSASAVRCRKFLRWLRFRLAVRAHVRLATLQVRAQRDDGRTRPEAHRKPASGHCPAFSRDSAGYGDAGERFA